jgi:hypothetical protein
MTAVAAKTKVGEVALSTITPIVVKIVTYLTAVDRYSFSA